MVKEIILDEKTARLIDKSLDSGEDLEEVTAIMIEDGMTLEDFDQFIKEQEWMKKDDKEGWDCLTAMRVELVRQLGEKK